MVRSIEVTSSAGSDFSMAGCWALAKERSETNAIARMPPYLADMKFLPFTWENSGFASLVCSHGFKVTRICAQVFRCFPYTAN